MLNRRAERLIETAVAEAESAGRTAGPGDVFLAELRTGRGALKAACRGRCDSDELAAMLADMSADAPDVVAVETWLEGFESSDRALGRGDAVIDTKRLLREAMAADDPVMKAFRLKMESERPEVLAAILEACGDGVDRGGALPFTLSNLDQKVLLILRKAWNGGSHGAVNRRALIRVLVQQPDSLISRVMREQGLRHPLESVAAPTSATRNRFFVLERECVTELVEGILRKSMDSAAERGAMKLDERHLTLGLIDDAMENDGSELRQQGLDLDVLRRAVEEETAGPDRTIIPIEEIENHLNGIVINQRQAVAEFARIIRRIRTGLSRPDEVAGVLLLVGPSGVGKTYLAKVVSTVLYGLRPTDLVSRVVTLEGGRYKSRHEVSALFGAAPGYVGMHAGVLTNGVKEKGPCVIIFDEAEKMNKSIWHGMLTAINDGVVFDSSGRTYGLGNCLIVLTSNAGVDEADDYFRQKTTELFVGDRVSGDDRDDRVSKTITSSDEFWNDSHCRDRYNQIMLRAAEDWFEAPMYSRIDEKIGFNGLRTEDYEVIAGLALQREIDTVYASQGVRLIWRGDAVPAELARMASSALKSDARYLNRLVRKCIVDDLVVREIIAGRFTEPVYEILPPKRVGALLRQDPGRLPRFKLAPESDPSVLAELSEHGDDD